MTIFERVLGGNIFYDFWKQAQQYIFSEGRFIQLITLQPIEIYKSEVELEIDTAKVKLFIKSNVESLVQRRIDRAINLLTLNSGNSRNPSEYDFDVIIKAKMTYEEVSNFFNHHFSKQTYAIEEGKYFITIEELRFSSEATKVVVHMPFMLESKRWFLQKKLYGTLIAKGFISVDETKCIVRTRSLEYELQTKSNILKVVDHMYYEDLINFFSDFLQYNFKEELLHAKTEAQNQINSFQSQTNWVRGQVNHLDLERFTIEEDGVHADFLADGKLSLV